jgi:hypothetical protein
MIKLAYLLGGVSLGIIVFQNAVVASFHQFGETMMAQT